MRGWQTVLAAALGVSLATGGSRSWADPPVKVVPVKETTVKVPPPDPADGGGAGRKQHGSLLFAGGGLRFDNAEVWGRFMELAGGHGASVVVIPAASRVPQKTGQSTVDNFNRYGAKGVMLPIAPMLTEVDYHAAARDPVNVAAIRRAKGIWFTGGDQRRITQALLEPDGGRTPALAAIWEAFDHGAVIGGTSAGAAIMSRMMFANAMNSLDTIKYGITKGKHVDAGLGFVGPDWFVDQHFLTRGRFARSLNAMRDCGFRYGIGVDEDTAVVFKDGRFDVIGYRGAVVMDLTQAQSDLGLSVFNMRHARLSYLDAGDSITAATRAVTLSPRKQNGRKVVPADPGFAPYFTDPAQFYFSNMLAPFAIYDAMCRGLDSRAGHATGIAFARPEGGEKNDLAFEFRVYRGPDSVGWFSTRNGDESYTVLNMYVDVIPVKLANPLFVPIVK